MFERKHDPLAPLSKFFQRILFVLSFGIILIVFTIMAGMIGLKGYEAMSWLDAFANSSMIISGVGAITPITTSAGKVFTGIYSLIGNVIFMSVIAIIFSPIIHRGFHKFHLDYSK
jgi:hypothetical protein